MSDGVGLSVVICTYNRCELLRTTLEEMTRLLAPPGATWELLVVNNASTDDTDLVTREFESRLPLRALLEPRPGKSHAANTAVREARGKYLIWTDDDVLVHPDWLCAYWRSFAEHPEVSMFGGSVEPEFLGDPPAWVHAMVEVEGRLWAAIEPDDPARPFTAERVPLGANMALKREAHLRFPFDTRIGPRPKGEIRGEETRLFRQLMDAGEVGYWVPDARVKHLVPVERQSLSYVRRFFFGLGQTFYILYEGRKGDIMGRPPWAWFQAVRAELLFQTWRWTGRPERWLRHLMDASFAWGFLWGDRSGGSVEP